MTKIWIGAVVVLLLLSGGLFLLKQYIGDIRPAILPSNITQFNLNEQKNNSIPVDSSQHKFNIGQLPFNLSVPEGFQVGLFADQTGRVRDLQFSPEGILLASVPSENKVIALVVEEDGSVLKKVVVDNLRSPHGIAFNQGKLFIAEENRLSRFIWNGENQTAVFEKELFKLPSGGHDAHTLVFDQTGNLFVKVGSSCNICNETDPWRATVVKSDAEGNNPEVFAKGLRNAAFMTLHPENGEIWATENGRDMIGDDIPPEEVNIVRQNKDYGWPNCYGNKVVDRTFYKGNDNAVCEETEVGVALMQAHSAPLGLSFIPQNFAEDLNGDLLVAFHGSWNRSVPTGYKVVRLQVTDDRVEGQSDFLTGFIDGSSAIGRPVDVEFDDKGNLFVSDDKYGAVYVVSKIGD